MGHNTARPTTDWLTWITRLFLSGIFIYASVDKILHPADFAGAVYNYQILPDGLINLTALMLPWLELLLGICLLTGVWLPGAVLWSNGLLWTFFLALLFNHYRGLDVHCGCFPTRPDPATPPPTAWYLFRDPVFLLAGGILMFRQFMTPRSIPPPTEQLEKVPTEQ